MLDQWNLVQLETMERERAATHVGRKKQFVPFQLTASRGFVKSISDPRDLVRPISIPPISLLRPFFTPFPRQSQQNRLFPPYTQHGRRVPEQTRETIRLRCL